MSGDRPRLLFHSQHLLGIGHRVRAHRIAEAAAAAGFAVTLLEGGPPPDGDAAAVPGVESIQLPPVRSADAAFSGLVNADGRPVDDAWYAARAEAVLAAFARCRPHVVLVEGYPFARRKFAFELDPLLAAARRSGARTACSIRDILVAKPDARKVARTAATARLSYDRILVHGDPGFAPLCLSFAATPVVADKIVYTGYVGAGGAPGPTSQAAGDMAAPIIVAAGGGAVGGALYRTALHVRRSGLFMDRPWHILVGGNLPGGDRDSLSDLVPSGGYPVTVEPVRSDYRDLLAGAALSLSQAGYNTVLDLAEARCRSILVPFEGTGETEQPTRARLLADRGLAMVIPEKKLDAERLARTIETALAAPPPGPYPFRTDGAERTAAVLRDLASTARLL